MVVAEAWKTATSLGVVTIGTAWTFALMASQRTADGVRWYDGRRWSWVVLPDRTFVVARDRRLRSNPETSRLRVESVRK